MTQKICPKCNKSVGTIKTTKKDPKTLKYWKVESCFKCGYNFDLEEVTREIDRNQKIRDWNRHFGVDGD